jgi:hypothetical protein
MMRPNGPMALNDGAIQDRGMPGAPIVVSIFWAARSRQVQWWHI